MKKIIESVVVSIACFGISAVIIVLLSGLLEDIYQNYFPNMKLLLTDREFNRYTVSIAAGTILLFIGLVIGKFTKSSLWIAIIGIVIGISQIIILTVGSRNRFTLTEVVLALVLAVAMSGLEFQEQFKKK